MILIWYLQVENFTVEWHCSQISNFSVDKIADMNGHTGILKTSQRYCKLTLIKRDRINNSRTLSASCIHLQMQILFTKRIILFVTNREGVGFLLSHPKLTRYEWNYSLLTGGWHYKPWIFLVLLLITVNLGL